MTHASGPPAMQADRRARAEPVLVLGQRPRDHLPGAATRLRRARPRRDVPRARRALVCRQPRPRRTRLLCRLAFYDSIGELRALARRHRACRRGHRRLLRARRAWPWDVWCSASRAGVTRLLRHRHAGHARRRSARGDVRISRADADPGLRPLSLLHRRPDAATGSSANSVRPRARALYCSVDPDAVSAAGLRRRAGTSAISAPIAPTGSPTWSACCWSRHAGLPHLRFVVAGPQYPGDIDWPANVERLEHVAACASTPRFYAASRFTLNVTRRRHGAGRLQPSVRLFEAAACGTPIVSDNWSGLDTLFEPGTDIALAYDAGDVLDLLSMPEADRRRLGQGARARIETAHSAHHRARELEAAILQSGAVRHSQSRSAAVAGA